MLRTLEERIDRRGRGVGSRLTAEATFELSEEAGHPLPQVGIGYGTADRFRDKSLRWQLEALLLGREAVAQWAVRPAG